MWRSIEILTLNEEKFAKRTQTVTKFDRIFYNYL